MSKRLQVLLDERELRQIQKLAREGRVPVSEWVRRALRAAAGGRPAAPAARKLAVLRAATAYSFPTGEIEHMLADIEQGYLAR
jgi:hypothetical protein